MTRHRDQPTRLLLAPGALGGCLGRRGGRQSRYLANTLGSLNGLRDALLGQESDDVLRKVRARVADSSYEAFAGDAPVNRGIEQDTLSDIDFLRRRIRLHTNAVVVGKAVHVGTLKSNKNRSVAVP